MPHGGIIRCELREFSQQRFGFAVVDVPATVGDLWALAQGMVEQAPPKPPPRDWFNAPTGDDVVRVLGETIPEAFVRRALENAETEMGDDLKGLILDLRNNPGGLLDQAVEIADLFLDSGRIISTRGRHSDSDQTYDATSGTYGKGLPIAVLINGKSASAAEVLTAALRDPGRAAVLGSSSYGKGTVQTIIELPNGGEIIITWAHLHAPSGPG